MSLAHGLTDRQMRSGARISSTGADRFAGVRLWLWSIAALVFLMVVVGGATRLTESGLSITEWQPITGVLPPLTDAQWLAEFEKYKRIPQYAQMFPDMDVSGFRFIFLWEWSHRLLGRLIGVVFALPFLWFLVRGVLTLRLGAQLAGVLALGGLQGAVGWWMVASGLSGRVEVAPERLATHLLLASLTFVAVIWLAVGLRPRADEYARPGLKRGGTLILCMTLLQLVLGALVAGSRAGLVYNTWPLMDGSLVPPLEHFSSAGSLWANLFENPTTVQFNHRLGAYVLLALTIWHAVMARRTAMSERAARRSRALVGLVLVQAVLGVTTLLLAVPLWAGLLHQAFAMAVLAMATVHRRCLAPV